MTMNKYLVIRFLAVIGLTAVTVVALSFAVTRVNAWTFNVSGVGECDKTTGKYNLTWKIENPESEQATIAASDRTSVSGTIPANDSQTYTESVPGTSTSESLTVRLEWPSDKSQPAQTATIDLAGDCEKDVPTPPKPTPKPTPTPTPVVPSRPLK